MSTRAHIELLDFMEIGRVLLYHHYDGMPERMVKELTYRLLSARDAILSSPIGGNHMWDCERVGALFIAQSSDPTDPYRGALPRFQPAACWHGDVEYFYRVILREPWQWVIKGYRVTGGETQEAAELEHVGTWSYKSAVIHAGGESFGNPFFLYQGGTGQNENEKGRQGS